MILYRGKIYDDTEQSRIISQLRTDLYKTFSDGKVLSVQTVINACDTLAKRVINGDFDEIVNPYLEMFDINADAFRAMVQLFSKESLEYKCAIELSDDEKIIAGKFVRKRYPLGILLHIAAGNVDALPAYSVIEGLLAGNVNILKLPAGDSGLSVKLLSELIKTEPELSDYISVFDVPSTETETLKTLADYSDGVVIWGGDEAVSAARKLADVTTKIISWGHKLSFAYADLNSTDEQLRETAYNICSTNQILCSSCQGIFVDTDSKEEQLKFAERFFNILKEVNKEIGYADFGMRAKNAINIYNEKLEQHLTHNVIMTADGVSVICTDDSKLSLSYLYRNVWIKRLPSTKIIENLRPYKGHLQTVGVLCPNNEKRGILCNIFAQAGLVRITSGKNMSRTVAGEAHDGDYALRQYSRIVETELF